MEVYKFQNAKLETKVFPEVIRNLPL